MKKISLLAFGSLLMTSVMFTSCNGAKVLEEKFCSKQLRIFYIDNPGADNYYLNGSPPGNVIVTATLISKDPLYEDISLKFNFTEEELSDGQDKDLLKMSYLSCSEWGGLTSGYCPKTYQRPTFSIEFFGDCKDGVVEIAEEDIQVINNPDVFEPSLISLSGVTDQSVLSILLGSNNPSGSTSVTVTSSFGESELVQLSASSEKESLYTGSLTTQLANEAGTNNDGTINAQNGTVLSVTFTNALDEDGNTTSISETITVSGDLAPTCSDGIQNGDEEGVDCGGSNCDACVTCSDDIQNGDETGVDCGGSNCDACVVDGLTFENTTYVITDASYLDYTANGNAYILFTISRYENQVSVFSTDIEVVSSTTITSETYTFGNADFGVTGSVGLNNVPDYATITGGSVILVITPLGDYALELNLMTDKGAYTGSHTVPGL
jgi:hypothetical protein